MTPATATNTAAAERPTYPTSWGAELVRNPSGRRFWYVSRFVSRGRVEYVKDVAGEPQCFRLERVALAAVKKANAS